MPPRRRAKAKATPRSDEERVRNVPLDEARERQEFEQRPEGEQSRIYHIAAAGAPAPCLTRRGVGYCFTSTG